MLLVGLRDVDREKESSYLRIDCIKSFIADSSIDMDRSSNGSGKLRSKITFQQMYLDSVSQGGHMGTLDEDKKFGNFKSKRPPLYLPDLSHCGIKSNLAPPITPATRRDGKVLKQFKRDALAAGRHYAELETRLNNQRTFQSLNHVTYLNKIMVRTCAFSMLLSMFLYILMLTSPLILVGVSL